MKKNLRTTWMCLALLLSVSLALPAIVVLPVVGWAAPAATGYDDDAFWEIGVEYVNWYPGVDNNLHNTDDDALQLYETLERGGWMGRFAYGNLWAWEQDWKSSAQGGAEQLYADSVDLAYLAGRSGWSWDSYYERWLVGPVFGDGGQVHDDPYLTPGDARGALGDGDLEWLAFSASQTLDDANRPYWAATMNGLHLLLGFATHTWDVNLGQHFGQRLRWGWTISQAWFGATDTSLPQHSATARVLINELCHYYYDRWGWLCADSHDQDLWYADHWVGGQPALIVDPADLDYEMPLLRVNSSAPSAGDLRRLATALGYSPSAPITLDDETNFYRATQGSLDLTVDQQGLYNFIDLGQLWSAPTDIMPLDGQPTIIPDPRQVADDFLTRNDLLPADATLCQVANDTLSAATIQETPSMTVQETISYTIPTAQQVIYSRHIVYTPTSGFPITLAVQGPGARLKVYVSNQGQVIGAVGGWRSIHEPDPLDTTPIITPAQVLHLYQQLGDQLNLAPTLFVADAVTVTSSTVGYYEQPLGTGQTILTPVYILEQSMHDSHNQGRLESTAFIPAVPAMMNPLAAITSYTETTPVIFVGDKLELNAANASQTLATLGYGADLDFSLGQAPYTYTWRLGVSGQVIGHGKSVNYQVTFSDYILLGRSYDVPLPIILEVSDSAGYISSSVRLFYFAEALTVHERFLPLIAR